MQLTVISYLPSQQKQKGSVIVFFEGHYLTRSMGLHFATNSVHPASPPPFFRGSFAILCAPRSEVVVLHHAAICLHCPVNVAACLLYVFVVSLNYTAQ
jgi:hypothetical protein